jgi:hypothetical protein
MYTIHKPKPFRLVHLLSIESCIVFSFLPSSQLPVLPVTQAPSSVHLPAHALHPAAAPRARTVLLVLQESPYTCDGASPRLSCGRTFDSKQSSMLVVQCQALE